MQRFVTKNPADWRVLSLDQTVTFANQGGRTVKMSFRSTGPVAIYGSLFEDFEDETLLGYSTGGELEVQLSILGAYFVQARAKDAHVWFRTYEPRHTVERTSDQVFTTIERRRSSNPEFDRMMKIVRLNEEAREKRLQETLKALNEQRTKLDAEIASTARQRTADKTQPGANHGGGADGGGE